MTTTRAFLLIWVAPIVAVLLVVFLITRTPSGPLTHATNRFKPYVPRTVKSPADAQRVASGIAAKAIADCQKVIADRKQKIAESKKELETTKDDETRRELKKTIKESEEKIALYQRYIKSMQKRSL